MKKIRHGETEMVNAVRDLDGGVSVDLVSRM